MPMLKVCSGILTFLAFGSQCFAQDDPFKAPVRPTEPLSPQDQLKTFKVPEGFEVQLFASDPDLLKPMNLAFDAKGRLWASMSREYPYAAPLDQPGRDAIKILEDTDGDGTADKITTFADGLNIPIGLYPYKNGVIAWSIPNIWYFEDTDGDDKADKRTILYGPMGFERDTHGMNNGFTRGFDGWLYACHGFNNQTTVKGADGHEISMQSGNTYRMRLHGERIEQYTWGQVNPFGMTIDEYGYLFTADCHSKPIYQLVREGYYPSFGKPHDGLGFVPQIMDHSHGSTAIAGVAIVSGEGFPEEYRGDAYTGNVMTSRINRDRLDRIGASVKAVEQPDFLSTSDPWFRPVDLQYGPDDALYVADFYNRIIGHYEVPLDHPGRDRTSGRIWRIVYRGKDAAGSAKRLPDLSGLSNEELIGQLSSPNLTKRMLITDWLSDTIGKSAVEPLVEAVKVSTSPEQIVHASWVIFRLGEANQLDWFVLLRDRSPLVQGHTIKMMGQADVLHPDNHQLMQLSLYGKHPFVQREAAEALGHQPRDFGSTGELVDLWRVAEKKGDPILIQTAKIAMRNLLRHDGALASFDLNSLDPEFASKVSEVCLGLNSEASGEYLLGYLQRNPELVAESSQYVEHAVKTLPANRKAETISLIRSKLADRVERQLALFNSVMSGMGRNRALKSSEMAEWANALVESLNEIAMQGSHEWSTHPAPERPRSAIPWGFQERQASDGKTIRVLSSFPNGEQLTGIVRSVAFAAPKKLSFYLCGHRGFPNQPPHDKNGVFMRDGAGNVLRTAFPPRNDVAQKIEWDLTEFEGKQVYFEAVDGDTGGAYAWLAFGRFEPPVIELPSHSPEELSHFVTWIANLTGDFMLTENQDRLKDYLDSPPLDGPARQAVARAMLRFTPDTNLSALTSIMDDADVAPAVIARLLKTYTEFSSADSEQLLVETVQNVPRERQAEIALELATSREGSATLLKLIEAGKISARHLQSENLLARLRAGGLPELEERLKTLTKNLPSIKQELRELIQQRKLAYAAANTSLERGKALFEKHCKNCHRIGDQGELVGPQLDGIGNRGLERLLEDVLDPNQNVDVAFHTMTIVLSDGKVLTGLFRREENGSWVLADNKGKEFRVAAADIEESARSPLSLMPENVAREFKPEEFFDLIGYLLEQTAKPTPSEE